LRERVAAGEKPRVVIRTASAAVAAGTRGNVVRFGDPADSEYVVVRLGKDEVPFAPTELGWPGRTATTAEPAPAAPQAATPAASQKPQKAAVAKPAAAPARKAASARRSRGPKRTVAPMVVTLRFRDGGWTVEAQRGARRLAKPMPLRPGAVSALTEHLDDEPVRQALVETVEACRAEVEQRAAELRAQLQATEATLRDYEARPRRR
jgi:hypothetical protein